LISGTILSHETGDIDYNASSEDLKLLFKETDAYRTCKGAVWTDWNNILKRMQAVQRDLQRNWKLRDLHPHVLRRMLTAYRNW
jgi:hypothetical protein